MSEDEATAPTTVDASPSVEAVEQTRAPYDTPAVRVEVCNTEPLRTLNVPALRGSVTVETAPGGSYQRILNYDPKRSSATVIGSAAFSIAKKDLGSRLYATWPQNVPLRWDSADELWAKGGSTDDVQLTVITEVYAD